MVGPILAPWTLLSGTASCCYMSSRMTYWITNSIIWEYLAQCSFPCHIFSTYFLWGTALRHDNEWWRLKPIVIPANSIHAPWTKAWTAGQSSGGPSSFVWTEGQLVTQDIDLSRDGSHLALDVTDLRLHRYDGATVEMGAFCEISKTWTVISGSLLLTGFN